MEKRFDAHLFLKNAPEKPGVYRMWDKNHNLLYVGKAKNLKKRLASYFQKNTKSARIALMVSQIAHIDLSITHTEKEALLLESNLIKTQNPRYNIIFRDDKSYPYIALSREDYPRLLFFRGKPNKNADYFGPFPNANAVRESMAALEKIFKLRTCENSVFRFRTRPCLLFQIKRCSGACTGEIAQNAYFEDVQMARLFLSGKSAQVLQNLKNAMAAAAQNLAFESAMRYRDQINALNALLEKQAIATKTRHPIDIVGIAIADGKTCASVAFVRDGQYLGERAFFPQNDKNLDESDIPNILEAFLSDFYSHHESPKTLILKENLSEEAAEFLISSFGCSIKTPKNRLEKAWVDLCAQNALETLMRQQTTQNNAAMRHKQLEEILKMDIARVECFDISHTQGEKTVASCVVYQDFAMRHKDYRQFNIENITPGDDYAAMNQALSRRYASVLKNGGVLPSLILIDGGLGQVKKAQKALEEIGLSGLPLLGVAKGVERKAGLEELILLTENVVHRFRLPPENWALHLIQEIRDESHRFAITRHRARRAKSRKRSILDDIAGIGTKRRKALIAHFGSVSALKNATLKEILSIPKMPKKLAEEIVAAFKNPR